MRVSLELQPCWGQMTGIGHYTFELAKRLTPSEDLSFQGNLFNFVGRHDVRYIKQAMPFPVLENHTMPYGLYRRLWRSIPAGYEAFFKEADLFHFFNYIVPPRIRGKVITTVHDMTHVRYPETVDKRNLRRIQKDFAYSIERSSLIMTSSEFSKGEIVELCGVPAEKVWVIYPAPSVSGGLCESGQLFQRLGIKGPYLLYVGSIEPRKNLPRLLAAYRELSAKKAIDCQLVLCGGKGWNNEEFYETLKDFPNRDAVILTGYLQEREKNTLFANARAVVFPSLYEGFGMPPLEAMYWGTPVVCSCTASLPEVAGNAACYVDPFSVKSIAEGIERVACDEKYAAQLVEEGRSRWRHFDWETSAEKMKQMYMTLAG